MKRCFSSWTLVVLLAGSILPHVAAVELTPGEQAWVAAHPEIRVGYDPQWPPFSYRDASGQFIGLDADMLALVGERVGLRLRPVPTASWDETYQLALHRQVDLLVGTAYTETRARQFLFTQSYQAIPVAIITRAREDFLWSVYDLDGRVVAGPQGYVAMERLAADYPAIQLRYTASMAEAFAQVSRGEADAVVTNLVNASFIIKTHGYANLKIVGIMPETFDLRYAVRPDWPELAAILDKGIASLTKADLQAINHRWVRVDYARVIRWDLVWKTAVAVLLLLGTVIGFLVWHYRALRAELVKRRLVQAELETTNHQLAAQHQEIANLMSVAAHDLRSPLTALQLGAELLAGSTDPEVRHRGGLLATNVRQMTQLVDDLLDVHAFEQGRRLLEPGPLDGAAILREVIELRRPQAEQKGIALDDGALPVAGAPVVADGRTLRQIFDNLVTNAMKFSPAGRRVEFTTAPWQTYQRFEVTDEGPGVPAEERERIFGKYARGSARPTGGERSTGLGLAIVREAVGAMNGRVWCEEAPGGGARFVVVIPASTPGAPGKST